MLNVGWMVYTYIVILCGVLFKTRSCERNGYLLSYDIIGLYKKHFWQHFKSRGVFLGSKKRGNVFWQNHGIFVAIFNMAFPGIFPQRFCLVPTNCLIIHANKRMFVANICSNSAIKQLSQKFSRHLLEPSQVKRRCVAELEMSSIISLTPHLLSIIF